MMTTVNLSFLQIFPAITSEGDEQFLRNIFIHTLKLEGKILRKYVDGKGGKTLLARRVKKTVMVFTLSYTVL